MSRTSLRFVLTAALTLGAAACSYNPDYGDGVLHCEPGGVCPGDLQCDPADNVCRSNPGNPGIDAGDGGGDDTDGTPEIDATIDTTPPNTTIQSSPSAISGPDVTFIVDSSEPNSTFKCSVDSTTLAACTSTQMFTALAQGTHTFRAAAVDPSGNEDPTPAEYTWMVDPNVLDTTITMGPGATTGSSTSFRFTSTRPGTFECQLSPGETSFTPCSSPKDYTGLTQIGAPGYTFQVRAKDTAGNLDPTPAMQTFMVDTTGPTVSITTPTNNATIGTSFNLAFTTEAGATYTCQLDNGTVINPCANGRAFMALTSAINPHTIKVTGTDPFGNTGMATNSFTVDDVGPSLTISGTPANSSTVATTSANLTFTISPANEPTPFTFECKFNAETTFTACTSFVRSGITDGTQTLQVRAKDRFGNAGGAVTHTWFVQATNTTILAIRQTPIATGTRVRLSTGIRVTAKTNNRFWVQEVDGGAAPGSFSRGITVMPTNWAGDTMVSPGRTETILGTVANQNGNLVLVDASYTNGSLVTPYSSRATNRDSLVLLAEVNEGMLVDTFGRASFTAAASCQNFDFCIVTCDRPTPVIDSIDAITGTQLNTTQDARFEGIVEGGNGSTYSYFTTQFEPQSDACL